MAEGGTPDKINISTEKDESAESIDASIITGSSCSKAIGRPSSLGILPNIVIESEAVAIPSSLASFSFGHPEATSTPEAEKQILISDSSDDCNITLEGANLPIEEQKMYNKEDAAIRPSNLQLSDCLSAKMKSQELSTSSGSIVSFSTKDLSTEFQSSEAHSQELNTPLEDPSPILSDAVEEHWIVRAIYSGYFDALSPDEPGQASTFVLEDVLLRLIPNLEKLLKQFELLNSLINDDAKESSAIGDRERNQQPSHFPNLSQMEQRVIRSSETEFQLEVLPTLIPSLGTLEELEHELSLLKEIMTKSLNYLIKSSPNLIAWCIEKMGNPTVSECNIIRVKEYAEAIFNIVIKLAQFKQRSGDFIGNFVGSVDDLAGLTYIMSVRTQIALGYSRILYELCTLNSNFENYVMKYNSASEF